MSQELTEVLLENNTEAGTSSPSCLDWFRKKFFTPKIVKNRKSAMTPGVSTVPSRKYCQPVTRKLVGGESGHIILHMDKNDRSFHFKCPTGISRVPVDRTTLMTAIAAVQGSEWVHIKLGTEVFNLNRAQLRAAFTSLETGIGLV